MKTATGMSFVFSIGPSHPISEIATSHVYRLKKTRNESDRAKIANFLNQKSENTRCYIFCECQVVEWLQWGRRSWNIPKIDPSPEFELAVRNLQFAKYFGSLRMSFCIFSKNCESLKSDTSWIFRVIHWTSYIRSYFKPNKYPLLNNNVISQRFIVHINFKLHTSFISIILLRSSKL